MKPFVRITCPVSKGTTIGRVEATPGGLELIVFDVPDVRRERRPGGPRVPFAVEEVRIPLNAPWLHRLQDVVVTWCRGCHSHHELPYEFVREVASAPGVLAAPLAHR